MFDIMLDMLWSPLGMLAAGIVLGVLFDEWFTTKFSWLKREGREALQELKDRI